MAVAFERYDAPEYKEPYQEPEYDYGGRGEETEPISSAPAPAPAPSGALPPATEDPWTRLGDVLAGIQAPGIVVPGPQAQTVTYVPTEQRNWIWLVLLLAAAGLAYWWYTQRKKGGG